MKKLFVILLSAFLLFIPTSCRKQSPKQTSSATVAATPDTIKIVLQEHQTFVDIDWKTTSTTHYELWLTTMNQFGRITYQRVYSEDNVPFTGVVEVKEYNRL